MSVEVQLSYDGDLSCSAVHGPSGATLRTTAPKDNGGDGSMFSPTDLVATAYGSCVMTIMAMAAEKHAVDLRGTTATVEKQMTDTGIRRIRQLTLTIRIPVAPTPRVRRVIEAAARGCPVNRSIEEQIETSMTIEWADDAAG